MAWRFEFYFAVVKTILYSCAALVRKILFSPLEYIFFAPPYNILYIAEKATSSRWYLHMFRRAACNRGGRHTTVFRGRTRIDKTTDTESPQGLYVLLVTPLNINRRQTTPKLTWGYYQAWPARYENLPNCWTKLVSPFQSAENRNLPKEFSAKKTLEPFCSKCDGSSITIRARQGDLVATATATKATNRTAVRGDIDDADLRAEQAVGFCVARKAYSAV